MKLAIVILSVVLAACGKSDEKKPAAETPAVKKVDRLAELVEARSLVAEGQPFDAALAKVEASIGKPSLVDKLEQMKVSLYIWARVEGPSCVWMFVQRGCEESCGDKVGKVGKVGPITNDDARHSQCVAWSQGKSS